MVHNKSKIGKQIFDLFALIKRHAADNLIGNARLAQGDDLATRFETEFGIDLRTPAQWIPKLLQHNHVVTGGAPVLFSTTRPGRIAATLKGLEGGSATDAELLQTLQSELVSIAPE